ncbi:MAG: 16S rRNA (cytosine(1402)-N(4))-methyltransferase RsmH [Campylobacteraceae bacterium]|nr:16S rRNA (cytosine(1402)-N(4))-methyltransferase RsmH [Campylobacteraceae bacterium]
MQIPHIPVMLNEVKSVFEPIKDGYLIDCTLGYGGHTYTLLNEKSSLCVIGCDRDEEAVKFSAKRLEIFKDRVTIEHKNFSSIVDKYEHLPIRGILADVGVSSLQLDKNDRGFGFDSLSLDMRMDKAQILSAYEVVNRYPKNELERILRDYGELREYKKIAKLICDTREKNPIKNAKTLADLVGRRGHINGRSVSSATLVFQAIRIEVNRELEELEELLKSIQKSKIDECIVCVISFHSLEDRIVKQTFKNWSKSCICPSAALRCECGNNHALGQIITKKALEPTEAEIKVNPRSRSSKLRAFYIKRGVCGE